MNDRTKRGYTCGTPRSPARPSVGGMITLHWLSLAPSDVDAQSPMRMPAMTLSRSNFAVWAVLLGCGPMSATGSLEESEASTSTSTSTSTVMTAVTTGSATSTNDSMDEPPDPFDDDPGPEGCECVREVVPLAGHEEAQTALAFAASALEHFDLVWSRARGSVETSGTATLTASGDDVRIMYGWDNGGCGTFITVPCPFGIEVDVQVKMSTADGLVDETWFPATLNVDDDWIGLGSVGLTAEEAPGLWSEVEFEKLQGTYVPTRIRLATGGIIDDENPWPQGALLHGEHSMIGMLPTVERGVSGPRLNDGIVSEATSR
jgi:hypothetical protein